MIAWIKSLFANPEDAPLMAPRSSGWGALRARVISEEKTCRVCGGKAETVHHKTPVHVAPALELVRANCAAVCDRCHLFVGHLGAWASWNETFDADAAWWLGRIGNRPGRGGQ